MHQNVVNVKFPVSPLRNLIVFNSMMLADLKKIIVKVNRYVKENWGSPFIFGFILLLVGAAISLSAGLSFADNIAVYAYYALVVGVFLQLGSFLEIS